MKAERRTILFAGHVQGVGFRATTIYLAQHLPLDGTVRNLPDGRVELVVEGPPGDIDALVNRLHEHFDGMARTVMQNVSAATGAPGPGIPVLH